MEVDGNIIMDSEVIGMSRMLTEEVGEVNPKYYFHLFLRSNTIYVEIGRDFEQAKITFDLVRRYVKALMPIK